MFSVTTNQLSIDGCVLSSSTLPSAPWQGSPPAFAFHSASSQFTGLDCRRPLQAKVFFQGVVVNRQRLRLISLSEMPQRPLIVSEVPVYLPSLTVLQNETSINNFAIRRELKAWMFFQHLLTQWASPLVFRISIRSLSAGTCDTIGRFEWWDQVTLFFQRIN